MEERLDALLSDDAHRAALTGSGGAHDDTIGLEDVGMAALLVDEGQHAGLSLSLSLLLRGPYLLIKGVGGDFVFNNHNTIHRQRKVLYMLC